VVSNDLDTRAFAKILPGVDVPSGTPMDHVLYNLARQHLQHPTISFQPEPDELRLAAIYTGTGLDHLGGEEPVALVNESDTAAATGAVMGFLNDNWKAEHFIGALLTTRRFIMGNLDAVSFPLEGVQGARVSTGILSGGIELVGLNAFGQPLSKKESLESQAQLGQFFQALSYVPPPARPVHPVSTELAQPSGDDPSGARRALALQPADPRVALCLALVEAQSRQGLPADHGVDLVRRILLFDKNERFGRGQSQGMWLSPLSAEDFEHVAHVELQTCTRRFVDGYGVLQLEFRWDSNLAKAAASSAVGAASVAVFGVGWSETPVTTQTTVRLVRFGSMIGFQVRACSGDRFTALPRGDDMGFVQDLHDSISCHEARALLLRSLFGWSHPLGQLQQASYQDLQGRAYQLCGQHDLAAFWA
jgi:hypothetical protein